MPLPLSFSAGARSDGSTRRRVLVCCLFLALSFSLGSGPVLAQEAQVEESDGVVDGVRLGVGLTTYHGELMAMEQFTMGDVLRGGIDLSVAADHQLDPVFFGMEAGFNRIHTRNAWRSFENHVYRLEGQAGIGLGIVRPGFIRFYTGLSVLAHNPQHDNSSSTVARRAGVETKDIEGMTVSAGVPFFLVVDEHVRIGVRWMVDDYIDNAAGDEVQDFLLHFGLTHRFDL